jgi:hypothetical protein
MESQPHGSYAETTFEEVAEANRPGTWTINALPYMWKQPKSYCPVRLIGT